MYIVVYSSVATVPLPLLALPSIGRVHKPGLIRLAAGVFHTQLGFFSDMRLRGLLVSFCFTPAAKVLLRYVAEGIAGILFSTPAARVFLDDTYGMRLRGLLSYF